MKKKVAKLQLNRETVRNLTEGDLKEAAGGVSQTRCTPVRYLRLQHLDNRD